MPRFIAFAAFLGTVSWCVFALAACPAQAQSSLIVGYNSQDGTPAPGHMSLSDTGTVVSGNYWFYGDDLAATNQYYYLETDTTSVADISGGGVTYLYAADSSIINLSGGTISNLYAFNTGTAYVLGGTVGTLTTVENGVIDLQGTNLTISGSSADLNRDGFSDFSYYMVTGTLQNSQSPFTAYYDATSSGTLEFNGVPVSAPVTSDPVPEASTVFSFGLLLALGGVFVKKARNMS